MESAVWIVLAVAFAVGEVLTAGFFLAPFGIGAVGATIATLLGAGVPIQVAVFAALTGGSIAGLRPIARRHIRQPASIRTGTDALVGRSGIVVGALEGPELAGSVRLDGEVWTARSAGIEDVPAGTRVTVLEIRGATAIVTD